MLHGKVARRPQEDWGILTVSGRNCRLRSFRSAFLKTAETDKNMTTLDDKILGFKSQNYVSSSESEGEDNEKNVFGEEDSRDDNKVDMSDVPAPPDFRLEVPKVICNLSQLGLSFLSVS